MLSRLLLWRLICEANSPRRPSTGPSVSRLLMLELFTENPSFRPLRAPSRVLDCKFCSTALDSSLVLTSIFASKARTGNLDRLDCGSVLLQCLSILNLHPAGWQLQIEASGSPVAAGKGRLAWALVWRCFLKFLMHRRKMLVPVNRLKGTQPTPHHCNCHETEKRSQATFSSTRLRRLRVGIPGLACRSIVSRATVADRQPP